MNQIDKQQLGYVQVLTINRPATLNALNQRVLTELREAILGIDPACTRCVVITGAGDRAFVAGADISAMRVMDREQAVAFSSLGNAVFRAIEELSVPVIAAVNGYALGGGCELALACDIRIASENAIFGQPEVSLGITTGFGGTQRLPRVIGVGQAKELLYTASRIDAQRAYELGLVNAVYPQDELMPQAVALAEKIAANAPIAVRATKWAINLSLHKGLEDGIAGEVSCFSSCFETEDQKNAMTATLEKRKAEEFVNR